MHLLKTDDNNKVGVYGDLPKILKTNTNCVIFTYTSFQILL